MKKIHFYYLNQITIVKLIVAQMIIITTILMLYYVSRAVHSTRAILKQIYSSIENVRTVLMMNMLLIMIMNNSV